MSEKQRDRRILLILFYGIAVVSILLSPFLQRGYGPLLEGYQKILQSSGVLTSEFFSLAGVGAAYLNAGIMLLIMISFIAFFKVQFSGILIASLFCSYGFSMAGIHLFNTPPIILGHLLYAWLIKDKPKLHILNFSLGCGPLVFAIGSSQAFDPRISIGLGIVAGLILGFFAPVVADRTADLHLGYSMYNISLATGMIATLLVNFARILGIEFQSSTIPAFTGDDKFVQASILVFALFLIIFGLILNRGISGYSSLLSSTARGENANFIDIYPLGLVLINMGIMTLFAWLIVVLNGGIFSGFVIGAMCHLTGFATMGQHMINYLPIILGSYIAFQLSPIALSSTTAVTVLMFCTTLAPITAEYGMLAAIIAGMLHAGLAPNLSVLHGWVLVYNNGYTGGIVAMTLVPIFNFIQKELRQRNY